MELFASMLPDGLSAGPASLLVVASFFTSATTAALGLGGGVMMLALMGLFLPVAALIPVQGLVQLGSNIGRTFVQRTHVRLDLMRPFFLGSIVGAIVGGFTVVQLPDQMMKIVLGIIAMLSMFLGATGPLMVSVFATLIPDDRKGLIATSAASLTVHHGLKVLVFGLIGFSFTDWLPLIGLMVFTGYLGTLSGSWLLSRIPEQAFRRVFKLLITVLALDMLRRGLGY